MIPILCDYIQTYNGKLHVFMNKNIKKLQKNSTIKKPTSELSKDNQKNKKEK